MGDKDPSLNSAELLRDFLRNADCRDGNTWANGPRLAYHLLELLPVDIFMKNSGVSTQVAKRPPQVPPGCTCLCSGGSD